MKIVRVLIEKLPTRYGKLSRLIKALDTQKILKVGHCGSYGITVVDDVEVDISCSCTGKHDINYNVIELTSLVEIYPMSIIKICKKHSLNIYDYTEWLIDKLYTNMENNKFPTIDIDETVIRKLQLEVK